MKENLVINDTIFIMDCEIKPCSFGTFWDIKSTPILEKMLEDERVIHAHVRSKTYTGSVMIFRSSKGTISFDLEEIDFEEAVRKFERHTVHILLLTIVAFYALTITATYVLHWWLK